MHFQFSDKLWHSDSISNAGSMYPVRLDQDTHKQPRCTKLWLSQVD